MYNNDAEDSNGPKTYLAGPIQHSRSRGKGWRQMVKERYDGIEWMDPLEKYSDSEADESDEWSDERIVEEDKEMIDEADAVLMHYEKVPTWGSPREHEYCEHLGEMSRFIDVLMEEGVTMSQIALALDECDMSWPDETPVYVQTTESDLSPWLTTDVEIVSEDFDEAVAALYEDFEYDGMSTKV